jgi:hypothetical protein
MAKLFSKISRLHQRILERKNDFAPSIFQCLKDKDLPAIAKKEALQMVSFLLNDSPSI